MMPSKHQLRRVAVEVDDWPKVVQRTKMVPKPCPLALV